MLRRIATALSWAPVALIVSDHVVSVHRARNSDMEPAVPSNALCVVRRTAVPRALSHGQVVAVVTADGSRNVLRRVVALPGDYVRPVQASASGRMTFVPPGFVWLEADEVAANVPGDSTVGKVPVACVMGHVTRTLPSGKLVEVCPTDRAFPSPNHQLYTVPYDLPRE